MKNIEYIIKLLNLFLNSVILKAKASNIYGLNGSAIFLNRQLTKQIILSSELFLPEWTNTKNVIQYFVKGNSFITIQANIFLFSFTKKYICQIIFREPVWNSFLIILIENV